MFYRSKIFYPTLKASVFFVTLYSLHTSVVVLLKENYKIKKYKANICILILLTINLSHFIVKIGVQKLHYTFRQWPVDYLFSDQATLFQWNQIQNNQIKNDKIRYFRAF